MMSYDDIVNNTISKNFKEVIRSAKDNSIAEIFSGNISYNIPLYQREYVWGKKHVLEFLEDIFGALIENKEYFIGTVEAVKDSDVYRVNDGQQRLITLYLILVVLRNYGNELGHPFGDFVNRLITYFENTDVLKTRISFSYNDESNLLGSIYEKNSSDVIGSNPKPGSAANIRLAYIYMEEFFKDRIKTVKGIDANLKYVSNHVKLVLVSLTDGESGIRRFETSNSRGVLLTPLDLLKNRLFENTSENRHEELADKWFILMHKFDVKGEKVRNRYMRYASIAHFDEFSDNIPEKSLYDWLVKNNKIGKDAFEFINIYSKYVDQYLNIINKSEYKGESVTSLVHINEMSNAQAIHLILLLKLMMSDVSFEFFSKVCESIENLMITQFFLDGNSKDLEKHYSSIKNDEIKRVKDKFDIKDFCNRHIDKFKKAKAAQVNLKDILRHIFVIPSNLKGISVDDFKESILSSGKTVFFTTEKKAKRLLSKISRYLDSISKNNIRGTYMNLELEHILSVKCPEIEFEGDKNLSKYRFGNLTLCEKGINGSIKNKPYTEKINAYRNSVALITKSLAFNEPIGRRASFDLPVEKLKSYSEWSEESVVDRSNLLADLLWESLDMENK